MAALQQTTITFRSQSPPTTTTSTTPSPKLTLSSRGLKLPKLSITNLRRRKSNGASGATMSASAAGSYASALADVAKANNTLEETQADIEKIEELFSNSEVYNFFNNPTVPIDTKRSFIADLAKESDLKPHVANFLNILIDMKRVELIKEIVKEFEVVYNTLTNTEVAVVTSVVKLESEHLAQIAKGVQKLTGSKNVRIKTVIDASLVAGFTIRYGNSGSKLIDMSVKKQLEEITAQLDLGDIQLAV